MIKSKSSLIALGFLVTLALIFSVSRFAKADDNQGGSKNGSGDATAALGSSQDGQGTSSSGESENGTSTAVSQSESESESSNGSTLLSITPQGKADIKGATVKSVSGSTVSISVFGLILQISTDASSTNFIGITDAASINTGDVVDVTGQIDASTGAVAAQTLKDQTQQSSAVQSIQAKIQVLLQEIQALRAQLGSTQGASGN